MRILIVNAHDRKPEYQKAFQDLLACIKEVLRSHNGLLEIQDEYIIRTRDSLDDFLYDENTSFSQINPGKQFDSLDFVIVSGDLHSLPWHPSNVKVLTLLRMCLKVKKCLFAIGFAMQALVFLSASNLNHDVNVINGGGKGGKLGDIGQLQIPPENIAAHDLFLDNVTGDLYYFQYETNEWAPLCNIGLHHSRTAQEYNTIGKFVIKTPIYRPKKLINSVVNTTLLDENVEIKCFLKKIYLKHWLFQSCDMEFVVPCKGRWETHPFNFTNKEKTFEVLAESQHGPLVIEYPRIVGVKFSVTKRYKETYQMFSNFIVKYSDDIICKGKAQNMSILAHITHPDAFTSSYRFNAKHTPEIDPGIEALSQRPGTSHHQKALMGFKHRKVATDSSPPPDNADGKVFKHSGLATKMKGKFILDHNYISSGKVRYDSQIQSPSRENSKFLTKETLMGKYALLPKKMQTEDDLSFVDNTNTKESYDRSILKTANMSYRNNKRGKVKGVSIYEQQKGIVKHTMEDDASLTKEDVRRWLYPDLNELKGEFDKKAWVPGNLSSNKSETFYGSRSIRINTCSPDYRKKGPLPNYNLDPSETQQKSLRAADPYKSLHDLIKEHQKKEDEKIIGPRKFNLSKNSGVTQNLSGSPSSRFASISMLKPKDWL